MSRQLRRGVIAASYQPPVSAGVTLVQEKSGNTGDSAVVPPFQATLDTPATVGNTLLLAVASDATVATPDGWTAVSARVNVNGLYLWRLTAEGGEDEVDVTPGATVASAWWMAEVSGMNPSPLQTANADVSVGNPTSGSTGTTGSTTGATDGLALAVWGITILGGATRTVTAMSNSYTEHADTCTTTSGNNLLIAVGMLTPSGDGTFGSTATVSGSTMSIGGIIAVFAAA